MSGHIGRGMLVALLTGLCLATPQVAHAHAHVESTTPTDGSTVTEQVPAVSVTFDEPVTLVPRALQVTTDVGTPVPLDDARLRKGVVLSARLQDQIASGDYVVAWRVRSDDGHIESGTFRFTAAVGGTGHDAQSPQHQAPAPGTAHGTTAAAAESDQPTWPVALAAALAVAAGLGAALVVRRGLRLLRDR